MAKFQSQVRLLFLKRTTCKQKRDILAFQSSLKLKKLSTLPVNKHLSGHVAVSPRSGFGKQQEFEYPVSSTAGTFKVSNFTKPQLSN